MAVLTAAEAKARAVVLAGSDDFGPSGFAEGLERALAACGDARAWIGWRPFQLNPYMPVEGMERGTYLAKKFGSRERAERVYAPIIEAGREEGIAFAFDRINWLIVLVIAVSSLVGALIGTAVGRRLKPVVLRGVIVALGLVALFVMVSELVA